MQTRREILSGFSAIPLAAVMPQADSLAQAREGRDKELLVEATAWLADGRYTRARLLLNTLVNTYPQSPLVSLAEMLVFYSIARERAYLCDGTLADGDRILADIHEVVARHRRPCGATD